MFFTTRSCEHCWVYFILRVEPVTSRVGMFFAFLDTHTTASRSGLQVSVSSLTTLKRTSLFCRVPIEKQRIYCKRRSIFLFTAAIFRCHLYTQAVNTTDRLTNMNMIMYTCSQPLELTQSTATYRNKKATMFLKTLIVTNASATNSG